MHLGQVQGGLSSVNVRSVSYDRLCDKSYIEGTNLLMERAIFKHYLISASLNATSSSFLCLLIAVLSASLLACC